MRENAKAKYRLTPCDQKVKLVDQEDARTGMHALQRLAIRKSCIEKLQGAPPATVLAGQCFMKNLGTSAVQYTNVPGLFKCFN